MLPFEWKELRRFGFSGTLLRCTALRYLQAQSFRTADSMIFLSTYAREAIGRSVNLTKVRSAVIPHGIAGEFFCKPRRQRALRDYSRESPLKLIYVSIVEEYKHQWNVVRAVGTLKALGYPVFLELIGDAASSAFRKLQAALSEVDPDGSFIRYSGPVSYSSLPSRYRAADINIFASSCENMPNILLEAMAAGLPIACSKCGPMPEIMMDSGVYFDPESADDIANAVRALIDSPALRSTKAESAYLRAQDFSWKKCAAETFAFLHEASIASQRKTSPISGRSGPRGISAQLAKSLWA
jgi:glycosyltransferase involved in cell wall biosynthesis